MPRTKKVVKKKTKIKSSYIVIDHPSNGAVIKSPHYAIRIGASPAPKVELSFNGKTWMDCRLSHGFWWFDWYGGRLGSYKLWARMASGAKRYRKSKPIKFTYSN